MLYLWLASEFGRQRVYGAYLTALFVLSMLGAHVHLGVVLEVILRVKEQQEAGAGAGHGRRAVRGKGHGRDVISGWQLVPSLDTLFRHAPQSKPAVQRPGEEQPLVLWMQSDGGDDVAVGKHPETSIARAGMPQSHRAVHGG